MINEVTETISPIKPLIIQTTMCKRNIKSTPFYFVGILQINSKLNVNTDSHLKAGAYKEAGGRKPWGIAEERREGSNREMRSFREDLNTKKWVGYEGMQDFRAKIQLHC